MIAIRTRIRRSLDDPRPSIPLDEAFDRIEKIHADRLKEHIPMKVGWATAPLPLPTRQDGET